MGPSCEQLLHTRAGWLSVWGLHCPQGYWGVPAGQFLPTGPVLTCAWLVTSDMMVMNIQVVRSQQAVPAVT